MPVGGAVVSPIHPTFWETCTLQPYSLQSNDSSVRYSKESHQFCAPFHRFVSLSFPRNVTVSFLHLLPENQEPGELAAQS